MATSDDILSWQLEDLRDMYILNEETDDLLEQAIRDRWPLERTMQPLLPLVCRHVGARGAWVRTFDERLMLTDFIHTDGRDFPDTLDELFGRITKHRRYVRRGTSGWTVVGQVLDVAGEAFGVAAVLLDGRLEAAAQERVAMRLNVWCEELDNHLAAIALMRHKYRVVRAITEALKDPVLDNGLTEAINILHEQIHFKHMVLVFKHAEDTAGTSVNYKVVSDGAIIHDSSAPNDLVLDGLMRAEAVRLINGQPTIIMERLGIRSFRENVLISGVKNQRILGRILVSGDQGDFSTFDRDLLERFADFIRLRIGDFNREWKQLSLCFPPSVIRRLLAFEDYRTRFLGPTEADAAVIFADISGFTRLCERLSGPATIGQLINAWSAAAVDIIWDSGGVFDKMVGDCVIGMWGPPFFEASPKAICRRALDAAKRIRAATHALYKSLDIDGIDESLTVAVGLNYCKLLVGALGPNEDYTGVSSGMNNTARLQGVAVPGEILCMEEFVEHVDDPTLFGEPAAANVKNVAAALRYRPFLAG